MNSRLEIDCINQWRVVKRQISGNNTQYSLQKFETNLISNNNTKTQILRDEIGKGENVMNLLYFCRQDDNYNRWQTKEHKNFQNIKLIRNFASDLKVKYSVGKIKW